MKNIFVYEDDMIDLSKVSCIYFDGSTVTFYMDGDWEYELNIKKEDINKVKIDLIKMFKSL